MQLHGEFALMASGPASDETRRAFEADGLTPPKRGGLGAGAGPVEDIFVAWFYLEEVSPGLAGALAASAVQAVTHVVGRMTKWFRAGESPAPEARNHIVVSLGGIDNPNRLDVDIPLGPQYESEEIEAILRAAMNARKPTDPDDQSQ